MGESLKEDKITSSMELLQVDVRNDSDLMNNLSLDASSPASWRGIIDVKESLLAAIIG